MKIRIANDYTTPDGETLKAGSTHDVDYWDGRNLIHRGKAVEVLSPGQKAAATRAAKAKGTKSATAEPTSAAAETTSPAGE